MFSDIRRLTSVFRFTFEESWRDSHAKRVLDNIIPLYYYASIVIDEAPMTHHISDLCDMLIRLESRDEAYALLKDICTPQEIGALAERWRVCQLLDRGDMSYRDIHQATGASLTTIGRVARFLKDESYQGYRQALDKTKTRG